MKKTWSWSVFISPFMGQPMETILETCRYAGLSAVDGTYRFFQSHSDSEMDEFAEVFRNGGIRIETFHLPFTSADDVTSFYETVRRGAVDRIRTWWPSIWRTTPEIEILIWLPVTVWSIGTLFFARQQKSSSRVLCASRPPLSLPDRITHQTRGSR